MNTATIPVTRNGGSVKTSSLALSLSLSLLAIADPLAAQGAPPQGGANQPYTMEYYYKVQWGRQQEFLLVLLMFHYPVLM